MKTKGTQPFTPGRARRLLQLVIKGCVPFVFFAAPSWAAGPAEAVFGHPATPQGFAKDLHPATAALKDARTLRGSYTQDKRLAGLPHPLHAEGQFLFVRDLGIAWQTTLPFDSELVITGNDIIQRENGQVSMHLSAAQQPAVRVVAEIFSAVFALDFGRLSANFELYSRRIGRGWELGLKPRGGTGPLKQIVVSGGKQVERVRVSDANGDETDIRLRTKSISKDAPAPADLARFKP